MTKLHRLANYLEGTRDFGVWLPRSGETDKLIAFRYGLGELQEDEEELRLVRGWQLLDLYRYARSLQMLCLSSGEAEFNGGVAACSEGLFMKEIFGFVGHPLKTEVCLDSSAARGVFQRQGVGRIQHLEVKSLWVQEALQRKLFSLHAVALGPITWSSRRRRSSSMRTTRVLEL